MKRICSYIANRGSWRRIVLIVTIVYFVSPYLIGPCFDKEFLNSIDTNKICENYERFEEYKTNEEFVYVTEQDMFNEEHIKVEIYIYKENLYNQKATIWKTWYRYNYFFSFDSVTEIKKNNVKIIVTEFTSTPRSKKAQEYLEEVLAQLE